MGRRLLAACRGGRHAPATRGVARRGKARSALFRDLPVGCALACVVALLAACDTVGRAHGAADTGVGGVADVRADVGPDVAVDVSPVDGPAPDAAGDVPLADADAAPDVAGDVADGAAEDAPADSADAGWRCAVDADCAWLLADPADPCRVATCDTVAGACRVENAGDGTSCDDDDRCTTDTTCGGGVCAGGAAVSCDDGDACTSDTCSAAAGCVSTPIADCCHVDADCDDGSPCTSDRCPGAGTFCKHLWIDGCCATAADCADGDPCTADACTPEGCAWTSICCEADVDCDDGLDCTSDRCLEGTCVTVADATSECCTPEALATGFDSGGPEGFTFSGGQGAVVWSVVASGGGATGPSLYYGDPVRRSYDTGGANGGTALSPVFVLPERAAAELRFRVRMNTESYFENLHVDLVSPSGSVRLYTNSSGSHTWESIAVDLSGAAGLPVRFAFVFSADSSIFDEGVYVDDVLVVSTCALNSCITEFDCGDGNGCTAETCDADAVCAYEWLAGCCVADADCEDGNPCTRDRCQSNVCQHDPTGDASCCVTDDDCADDDPCTTAACVDFACEIEVDLAACPYETPYTETFDTARTLGAVGWEAVDLVAGGPTNWSIRAPEAPFGTPFLRFDYDPVQVDYEHCVRSPALDITGSRALTVEFAHRFSSFVGSDAGNRVDVRWSTDGWASSTTLWSRHESEGDVDFERRSLALDVSPLAAHVAIAFCVSGEDSFEINFWDVDDVQVLAGEPPHWAVVPATVAAVAGEVTEVDVSAQDPDGDPLHFALGAGAPAWASLAPLGPASARLTLAPGADAEGSHPLTLWVDDGGTPVAATVTVTVALAGETVLLEEDFAEGTLEALGWVATSDPGSHANDWQLVTGDPFASRHARFSNAPAVTDFSDALESPPVAVSGFTGLRVRWRDELHAGGDGVATPPVVIALQVSADGGLWQTVWSHAETDGELALGPRSVDVTSAAAGARTLRVRFRVRGGRSSAIERWAVDDVVVFGR